MLAAGEPSSERAPPRYREECKKTAELIKDKTAGGRWYETFPRDQAGNLGREIRIEHDTGIELVCTSGKRAAAGIDLATRGIPEALADMAANEGVTGGIVLYDCMFRFVRMSDYRILAARAERVAARRAGTLDDRDHADDANRHQEKQSSRSGESSAGRQPRNLDRHDRRSHRSQQGDDPLGPG